MKFNPITNELFTDDERFIKKMNCPYMVSWMSLATSDDMVDSRSRLCQQCQRPVVDATQVSEQEILAMQQKNPNLCLKIDIDSDDILLVTAGQIKQYKPT